MRKPWLIAALAGVLFALTTASALAQVSDADLANRVAAKVRDYVHFSIFDDVNVEVSNLAVTLTGYVTMPYKRTDIGNSVSKIDGVRTLSNDIRVLPVSNYDSDLRVRIAQAIYGNPSFWRYASMPAPPIHIVVDGGKVTLTGRVNGETERMLAYALAQVPGAFSVKNDLKLDR